MSRFDSAVEKFDRAMERVRQAVERSEASAGGESEALTSLQSENARLRREIGALREGAQALDTLTGEIETRLDATIQDMRNLIEEEQ